ncbi:MAG TPA: YfiR family protein, partial [Tepidisphaeraceae bacterium]|nr:YfiR family protein [Tepidisphaeraceae bacterium]
KTVQGRHIVVKRFASVDQIQSCHLLFVPAAQDAASEAIVAKIGHAPVLTLGEGDSFMAAGGGIRLFLEEGRMKFQLAPDVLEASKLKASAKLMKLARVYRK